MRDAPTLPELGRSLRALGAQRDVAAELSHTAIFLPLLDARARAAGAPVEIILSTLRGDALSARIEANAVDAAVAGVEQPARARALTAQTTEVMEPLRRSLLALDAASVHAHDGGAGWEAWVEALRQVFAIADVACQALARMLRSRPKQVPGTGWFRRAPK